MGQYSSRSSSQPITMTKATDEEENRWSKELANMSDDPGPMEDSIYAHALPGMEEFYERLKRKSVKTDSSRRSMHDLNKGSSLGSL